MADRRYLLIDGNSLIYRAFFALPTDLATAAGQVTNAVYGFTSMLINMLRDHPSDGVVVCFDRPEPTFRHDRNATYKAGRAETPDILRQQMGLVREVIEVLGISMVELIGYEADDIIATLATRARDAGHDVIVVTGDRDAYQLVEDPHIRVLYNKRGVSDYALYDEAGIVERTGVTPDRYVMYAAMRGDNSDNLPGVPGVGEKTAAKLVNKYGDLDGIFAHVDEQTPKLRENLAENEALVRENEIIMTLVRDAPFELDFDNITMGAVDTVELKRLFEFLEFHSLFDRLADVLDTDIGGLPASDELVALVDSPADVDAAIAVLVAASESSEPVAISAAFAGEPGRSPVTDLAVVLDSAAGTVVHLRADWLAAPAVVNALSNLFEARPILAHGGKSLLLGLWDLGVEATGLALDTSLAAYLLDPAETTYVLGDLLLRYARLQMPESGEAPAGQLDLGDDPSSPTSALVGHQALAVQRLAAPLFDSLDAQGLRSLNDDVEVPLVRVLASMERVGVGIDRSVLESLRDRLTIQADELRTQIWTDAGHEFNVNSTPQLRTVLFDELGLTPHKKTKTGFSTDAQTLEKMRDEHVIIDHLLTYREVEKLRSTYGVSLLDEIASDGRIHASFQQTVARTGRLSSDKPNLHNIPVRTEVGREFRTAFVPTASHRLLVADYNQIELRCIAHLAQDPGLIEAFESGTDIHSETASRIYGVDADEVTTEQRSHAKMVSYGLAYGMEAYGLGQRLNIPTKAAAQILDAYFVAFPNVHDYMDRVVAEARERGYTETLFGRRRQIPELSSSNTRIRQAGERQAMNAGIQGLAADVFKVALVRLDAAISAANLDTRIILQVHDEIICEVPEHEETVVSDLVVDTMRGAADLRVPLEVNLAFGDSWAAAK